MSKVEETAATFMFVLEVHINQHALKEMLKWREVRHPLKTREDLRDRVLLLRKSPDSPKYGASSSDVGSVF